MHTLTGVLTQLFNQDDASCGGHVAGQCNKSLDSTNCNDHDGEIYCNSCYRKTFGPKGYGFAAGGAGLGTDGGMHSSDGHRQ